MFSKTLWTLPLLVGFGLQPALTADGCGETTPTPTPEPTPTPVPDSDYARFVQYMEALRATSDAATRDALTQDFFYTVQYSDGFPIIEGNNVTFVYQANGEASEPYRVAGDFNTWNATSHSMAKIASDYNVYFLTVTLSNPRVRSMYKVVGKSGGTDLYFADPKSRRYQYDSYGMYSLIFGGGSSEKSHLARYPLMKSSFLDYDRDLFLYLPPGYDQETETYPVLYMHDGQNLFDPNAFYGGWKVDQVIDNLLTQGKMREVIVVGIANTPDRMDEYTQVEDLLPAYGGLLGGEAALYAQHIVQEVKPYIDAHYRTQAARESTGVLGSSLGGLVSFYVGYDYPEVFRFVGGMSSTFGWGSLNLDNPTMIDLIAGASKLPLQYYLDSGGDDGGGCRDSDGDGINDDNANADDNYCETQQMYQVLQNKGHTSADLKYVTVLGQEHNEASWNSRLPLVLTYFFPKP